MNPPSLLDNPITLSFLDLIAKAYKEENPDCINMLFSSSEIDKEQSVSNFGNDSVIIKLKEYPHPITILSNYGDCEFILESPEGISNRDRFTRIVVFSNTEFVIIEDFYGYLTYKSIFVSPKRFTEQERQKIGYAKRPVRVLFIGKYMFKDYSDTNVISLSGIKNSKIPFNEYKTIVRSSKKIIFTIGHSTHSLPSFYSVLNRFNITDLVDCRTIPYSKYVPHFNKDSLIKTSSQAGINYHFSFIPVLGGLTKEEANNSDKSILKTVVERKGFSSAISGVSNILNLSGSIALMCSERNPYLCHRSSIVSEELFKESGADDVIHLHGTAESCFDLCCNRKEFLNTVNAVYDGIMEKDFKSFSLLKSDSSILEDHIKERLRISLSSRDEYSIDALLGFIYKRYFDKNPIK